MLAEIFLLRLQNALRETTANAAQASNTRFVPIELPRR